MYKEFIYFKYCGVYITTNISEMKINYKQENNFANNLCVNRASIIMKSSFFLRYENFQNRSVVAMCRCVQDKFKLVADRSNSL